MWKPEETSAEAKRGRGGRVAETGCEDITSSEKERTSGGDGAMRERLRAPEAP